MAYLLLGCQIALALVLLVAAVGKVLRSEQFLGALRLSGVPKLLVTPVSLATPTAEVGLSTALLISTPLSLRITMAAAALLVAAFTAWMAWVYARGLRVKCGCFGVGDSEIGPRTIARNAIMMVVAAVGVVLSIHGSSPLPPPSWWLAATVTLLGACVALAVATRQALPVLVLTGSRLRRSGGNSTTGG